MHGAKRKKEMRTVETYNARIFVGFRPHYSESYSVKESQATLTKTVTGFVNQKKLCVTVTPTQFYYVNGSEVGCIVGLINYPRFPSDPEDIRKAALELGELLRIALQQHRVSIQFPDQTIMLGEK